MGLAACDWERGLNVALPFFIPTELKRSFWNEQSWEIVQKNNSWRMHGLLLNILSFNTENSLREFYIIYLQQPSEVNEKDF